MNFQASCHLPCLCILVCLRPGRNSAPKTCVLALGLNNDFLAYICVNEIADQLHLAQSSIQRENVGASCEGRMNPFVHVCIEILQKSNYLNVKQNTQLIE